MELKTFILLFLFAVIVSAKNLKSDGIELQNFKDWMNNTYEFNNTEAKYLYMVSQLPYGTEDKILNNSCGPVCDFLEGKVKLLEFYQRFLPDGEDITYTLSVNEEKKELYFSFKGTDSNLQLIDELTHSGYFDYKTEYFQLEHAKAMQYFQEVYLEYLHEDVVKNLKKYSMSNAAYRFVFCGFSLGGALSSLGVLDAITFGGIVSTATSPTLMTFGSPRVANTVLSDYLNSKIPVMFRITNDNDIVPHIPPCSLIPGAHCKKETGSYGFLFVGRQLKKEIWYYMGNKPDFEHYKECDENDTEDPTCSNSNYIYYRDPHDHYYGYDHTKIIKLMK